MLLALSATLIVIVALLWEVCAPRIEESLGRWRARRARVPLDDYDPGRERRAEQRARQLLRSCVNDEEWEMYRDLGFLRVWGALAAGPEQAARWPPARAPRTPTSSIRTGRSSPTFRRRASCWPSTASRSPT